MADQKSLSKLPTQQNVEDLLKSIEQSENKELDSVLEYSNDVVPFLSFYEIQPGEEKVTLKMLYSLYKEWSKKPVARITFVEQLNNFLIPWGRTRCYYNVNKKAWNLSKELFELIQKRTVNKTKTPNWKRHFELFINKYDIKDGKYWIECYILFEIYKSWLYDIKRKQGLGYNHFFNFCKLYLKHQRKTASKAEWFAVDKSITNHMSEEAMNFIRERHKHD